ncbi:MAG: glycoside hydrolase family 127 protein [Xanthomonadales bacterium]|nr:glycoside hydrolase family 127 protein [Xanthomonadales bacterium]
MRLGGVLGEAIDASRRGRLSTFVTGAGSPAIELFAPAHRDVNEEGDWYGEHAGKWLVAAARAAARSGDSALRAHVLAVTRFLVAVQDEDGYLGTYAPGRRFTEPQAPPPESWNGEPVPRTWDIWIHAYLVLGLLEVYRCLDESAALDAATRIGDLVARALDDGIDITALGNHHGLSATVFLDAAVELHAATGEARFLALAQAILAEADANPRLGLLQSALAGVDPSAIATGKAYQLAWNLVGLAKLQRATGDTRYAEAVDRQWQAIREHHLTLGGGPWGGVGHRSREVFNPAGVFSPHGYVETCSTLAWIQLNGALLRATGEARYAEEIERSAYNDLLAAAAPDGENWCYYVFPNGRRVHTTYWRCCKSSGAMALEELPGLAFAQDDDGTLSVHLLGAAEARFTRPDGIAVVLRQHTRYPHDGALEIEVAPDQPAAFAVRVRIPRWAQAATARLVDRAGATTALDPVAGTHLRIDRVWHAGDRIVLDLAMPVRVHRASHRNVQESRAPDGSPVAQQVLRFDWLALTRGPLVYATGLVDGFKVDETLRLAEDEDPVVVERVGADGVTVLELEAPGRAPLVYVPYFAAGGRRDGAWRLTWMALPPAGASPGPATTNPED